MKKYAIICLERKIKMLKIILSIIISFVTVVVIMPFLIPFLRKLKFGQQILEIGPNWHKNKQGTPTMGGIAFIIGIIIAYIFVIRDLRALLVLLFAFICGVVGFTDDFIKVYYKRNMGFNAKQKTLCLIAAMIVFILAARLLGYINTEIYIPFIKVNVDLSVWYYPLIVFVLFGGINSINLTDGIDGLAGSVTAVVSVFFAVTSFILGYHGLSYLSAAVLGGLVGFLVFNLNPAKVFMGDTGSLFLGGMITGMAVITKNPFILLVVGFVYVAESLSVILQVASFKLTGKRIFKMSPIHHHFEMCGWRENKIVIVFSALTAVLCIIGYLGV